MTPAISVVIPALCTEGRHGTSRLVLTLAGYANQTLSCDRFEVVVVDDGSDWDLREVLAPDEQTFDLRVLRREHAGMCAAYADGVAAARGAIVLLGIDDNVPCPALLERHVTAHAALDAETAVVCGRERFLLFATAFRDLISGELDPEAQRSQPALVRAVELFGRAGRGIRPSDVRDGFAELERQSVLLAAYDDIERTVASGGFHELSAGWLAMRLGNHSLQRGLLERAGGLDTHFDPSGFYADLDLGLRLRASGAHLVYDTEALMLHLSHGREPGFMTASLTGHAQLLRSFPRMDVALVPHFFSLGMTIADYSRHVDALPSLPAAAREAGYA